MALKCVHCDPEAAAAEIWSLEFANRLLVSRYLCRCSCRHSRIGCICPNKLIVLQCCLAFMKAGINVACDLLTV